MSYYDDEKVKRSAYTKTSENTAKRNYISSGNFKKSNSIQLQHNDRLKPPSYVIDSEQNNEINRNSYEALELKKQIIANAQEAYKNTTKAKNKKFQAKSYEWSLVVNIKPETTMQDLEKLADYFANAKTKEGQLIYGFQCYQIAIHRDEGHINEQGEKVINHHAHMEFITLDRQTGKNNMRNLYNNKTQMRTMQTMIAQILQMQRGEDKRLTGRQRIEPRKYAQMKEAEKGERKKLIQELENETIPQKQIKAILEDFRKQSIGKGYPKEFFRELSDLKQNTKEATLKDLKTLLNDLSEAYFSKLKNSSQELESQIKAETEKIYKSKLNALESDLKLKEQKNEELLKKINENDLKGNFELSKAKNEKELDFLEKTIFYKLNSIFNNIYDKIFNSFIEPKSEKEKKNIIQAFEDTINNTKTFYPLFFEKWQESLIQENRQTRQKEKLNYKDILESYKEIPSKELKEQSKELSQGR